MFFLLIPIMGSGKENQLLGFDIFGRTTKGVAEIKDKRIYYSYNYGTTIVTDCWQYVSDNTYKFIVGNYKDDYWVDIYLQTELKQKAK